MSERVWTVTYSFNGLVSVPYEVGCVCSEGNEIYGLPPDHWTAHYHTDGYVRRRPDRVIQAGQRTDAKEQPMQQAAMHVPVTEREALASVMSQAEADLKSAHAEICKLQSIDPAKHDWPDWSPQANTIRWFKAIREKFGIA